MAVSVVSSVSDSLVPAGSMVRYQVTFTNTGSSDATITDVSRLSPPSSTGFSNERKVVGLVVPAAGSVYLEWGEIMPAPPHGVVYDLEFRFLSDASAAWFAPASDLSIDVLGYANMDSNAVAHGLMPGDGSLWLGSNVLSGFLATV